MAIAEGRQEYRLMKKKDGTLCLQRVYLCQERANYWIEWRDVETVLEREWLGKQEGGGNERTNDRYK